MILVPHKNTAIEQIVAVKKWSEALATVEKARPMQPNSPKLLIWEAVLLSNWATQRGHKPVWHRLNKSLWANSLPFG